MVTVAWPDCDRSTREVAVTVTSEGDGAVTGAVYSPSDVIAPQAIPLQPLPERLHNTTSSAEPVAEN